MRDSWQDTATHSLRARLGLALCTSAFCAGALSAQMRVVVSLRGYQAPVMLDTLGSQEAVNAPPEKVFAAAVVAFGELRIPVNLLDPARGVVAATRFTRMNSLAGSQLSQFFSCGTGMTGPHANEWRLEIAIAALLDAGAEGTTRLRLATLSSAQDVGGSAKDPLPCVSTGVLEAKLLALIKRKN